ncbi:nucleoside phosphorylase [Psychromonas ossibalaenae]|uniref:nucleoside phosphorylase n=1 Tax=Psychromonas ossibalaenae TaxID=444922 RepID=UPI0003814941|nr:nucleoside phosphorylase [Psychromonas ossibalaenae]
MFLDNEIMPHVKLKKGDVGKYVLLPGDPFRTDALAELLDDPVLIAHNREHKTWTGTLLGEKVSVTSTGMGCPSTAIAVEELIACGADTFIRVGTAGRVNRKLKDAAMIGGIITGAVRDEGTTKQYVPVEYPAIADRKVVDALIKAAENLNLNFGSGISRTVDSFYSLEFPEMSPLGDESKENKDIWVKANVLLSEMEAAAILVISSLRGARASGIMAFPDEGELIASGTKGENSGISHACRAACEAIKILIESDKKFKQ